MNKQKLLVTIFLMYLFFLSFSVWYGSDIADADSYHSLKPGATLKGDVTFKVPVSAEWSCGDGLLVSHTAGGNPEQRFYWEVKAVRKDIEPLKVEVDKAGNNEPS